MTKFYRPRGHKEPAVLWNPSLDKAIYEFFQGVCETDDPEVIELLRSKGFSEKPISANVQVAMDKISDAEKPAPPAPPDEKLVPKVEPQVKVKAAPAPPPPLPLPAQ